MKIGSDGVLLGAWAKPNSDPKSILDIGTGTGVIALMLAQRFPDIPIDAIELEQAAAAEASYNFAQSRWFNRLNCQHISLQQFASSTPAVYDHIICNPPFYQGTFAIANKARDQARNQSFLPLEDFFSGVNQLLSSQGSCSLILPIEYKEKASLIAKKHQLYLSRFTAVKGNKNAAVKRALLAYDRCEVPCETTELILEIERNQRTKAHQDLVEAFYLSKP